MLSIFGMWSFLFPTRLYAIWYQNFYSFNTEYLSAVPLIVCIAYSLCALIYVFYKYTNVRRAMAIVVVSIAPIVAGIIKISPKCINFIGYCVNGMESGYLIFIWIMLMLAMFALASIYDEGLKKLFFKKSPQ